MNSIKFLLLILILMICIFLLWGCKSQTPEIHLTNTPFQEEIEDERMELAEESQEEKMKINVIKENDQYILYGEPLHQSFLLVEEDEKLILIDQEKEIFYEVDIENLQIDNNWNPYLEEFMSSKKVIEWISVSKGMLLVVEEEGQFDLYHYWGKQVKKVCSIFSKEDPLQYLISPDASKVAFVENISRNLTIYNILNQRMISIQDVNISSLEKEFKDQFIFSPKAGYITIIITENGHDIGFKTFGADTGRQVHDFIYGVHPTWSNNEQYIAFLYQEKDTKHESLQIDNENLFLSDKIGMYNRRNNKIIYLDELEVPYFVMGSPGWGEGDEILFFVGGSHFPFNIYLYSIRNKVRTTIMEEDFMTNRGFTRITNLKLTKSRLLFSFVKEGELTEFKWIQFNGNDSMVFNDVQSFVYIKNHRHELSNFIAIDQDRILFVRENHVYLCDGISRRCILKDSGEVQKIQLLDKNNMVVVYTKKNEKQKIMMIPMNKE